MEQFYSFHTIRWEKNPIKMHLYFNIYSNKTTLYPIIKIKKKAIRVVCNIVKNLILLIQIRFFKNMIIYLSKNRLNILLCYLCMINDYMNEKLFFNYIWVRKNHLQNYVIRNANDLHIQPHNYEYLLKKTSIFKLSKHLE